ncbi:MAG TPA: DUF2129 domain-containing protein [Bacillales bacterium]|nr:DUF2129 domain-containing protein [Bacillales bacterium]
MFNERIGLIVWVRSLKQVRALRKFGNIHYVSKRMKYVVVYCNHSESEQIENRLASLPYVKSVERSQIPFLKTEFQDPKKDKAKEYDYKIHL